MNRRALEFNGMAFEHTIVRSLQFKFPDAEFLSNRELFSKFLGKNTQIDVIMLHSLGIFVIEAKGWRRWIHGGYNDGSWEGQSSTTNIMTVPSPIGQNIIHIRSLRNAIRVQHQMDVVKFTNIVCLPDGITINSECKEVCNLSNLSTLIKSEMLQNKSAGEPKVDVAFYSALIQSVTT